MDDSFLAVAGNLDSLLDELEKNEDETVECMFVPNDIVLWN